MRMWEPEEKPTFQPKAFANKVLTFVKTHRPGAPTVPPRASPRNETSASEPTEIEPVCHSNKENDDDDMTDDDNGDVNDALLPTSSTLEASSDKPQVAEAAVTSVSISDGDNANVDRPQTASSSCSKTMSERLKTFFGKKAPDVTV